MFEDNKGELVDGGELLFLIAAERHKHRGCTGAVGTLMSNYGLELAFKQLGIPFARAGVGDRYVLEVMRDRGWMLGGESSGHIICGDVATTGDGVVSALQVVNALHILSEPLAQAKKGMIKLPQKMINVRLAQKISIVSNAAINTAVAEAEARLAGSGRVLLRASGTEPWIRVMVEGEVVAWVYDLARQLAEVVSWEVGL